MSYTSRHTGTQIDDGIDAANAALPIAGGTMTGALILHGNPTVDKGAATKKYVDDKISNIELTPGADGEPGEDGVSCTHSWNGTTLTVTSASGTSSADLKGDDGVSPSVAVTAIEGGNRVTITDAEGEHSFVVMNGTGDGSGSGGGSGDMLKAVYDSDGNGTVDNSEKLGGKLPSEYASATHTHDDYAAADHTHDDYAAASHTHDEYALADHTHNYVTSVNGQTGDVTIEASGGGSAGTVYSEDEFETGDTFNNGTTSKPIWTKVIFAKDLARGNGQVSLGTVLPTNIDTIISIRGMFLSGTDGFYRTVPCANFAGLTYLFTALADKSGNVKLFIGSSYSTVTECTLIVEYTKG